MALVIKELGATSKNYCELNGRTEPLIADVIMAFAELGINGNELPKYISGTQHPVLPSPQPQQSVKQLNLLSVGVKQPLPTHIPQHFPPFADPHAYVRTPVSCK